MYGGAGRHFAVAADIVTGGKGIAGGIPIGAYGLTDELAGLVEAHPEGGPHDEPGIALGGTLFANALSMACAEAVLTELMTPEAYERIVALGARLADGIESAAARHRLEWRAHRFGARSGYCLLPELPRNAREAHLSLDVDFVETRRAYFANRGIWDAISWAGPHVGFAHDESDVLAYLGVLEEFLDELCAG